MFDLSLIKIFRLYSFLDRNQCLNVRAEMYLPFSLHDSYRFSLLNDIRRAVYHVHYNLQVCTRASSALYLLLAHETYIIDSRRTKAISRSEYV